MVKTESKFKETEIGLIPDDWDITKLSNHIELINGFAFKGRDFKESGIPVIKIANVKAGKVIDKFDSHIAPEVAEKATKSKVERGDILITMTGNRYGGGPDSWVGKVAKFNLNGDFYLNQRLGIIRASSSKGLDINFIYYFLNTFEMQQKFVLSASGAGGQANISPEQIKSLIIPVPSTREQKKIVEVLGALDEKIELNRKMNKTLEEIVRVVFQEWFENFKYSSLSGIKKNTPLGEIPEEWNFVPLNEAFDFLEGPGIRNWQYSESGTRFINIRIIASSDIDTSSANRINQEDVDNKYEHFLLKESDIVISCSGTLGRSAIVRKKHLPLLLNTSVIRFRPKGAYGYPFMYSYLGSRHFTEEQKRLAVGSAQLNFGPTHLKQMFVIDPGSQVLERFDKMAGPFYEMYIKNLDEIDSLSEAKKSLLPKLMSGKLRVR